MLVLLGATPERNVELIGFQAGVRGKREGRRELLVNLKAVG
jgi:hypothetical protein